MGARPVARRQLAWLEGELARWEAAGHLDAEAVAQIRGQYVAGRRFSLGRLFLVLGASFVGVGLLWLVAANLDQISPVTRFTGVAALWLGAVWGGELLATRRSVDGSSDAVVGAVRLVAVLAFGAVVFQAAQSLQVPAFSSVLVAAWAAGALVYAYATRAVAPLLVGVVAGVGWYVWAVTERTESAGGTALALLLAGVLATAVAAAHSTHWLPRFAPAWRAASALLALAGLFLAALPQLGQDVPRPPLLVWLGAAGLLLLGCFAAAATDRVGRGEIGAAVLVAVFGLLVLGWQPPEPSSVHELSGEALLRSVVAILLYLLAATWFAVLGVLRDTNALTQLATAALVLFTVVQSFAVFEPILSGAALFLTLGAVLAGTGYVVDRGRRRLVADVREVAA